MDYTKDNSNVKAKILIIFLLDCSQVSILETSVDEDGLVQNDEEKSDDSNNASNSTNENQITDEQVKVTCTNSN